jgi:hypothetical protein
MPAVAGHSEPVEEFNAATFEVDIAKTAGFLLMKYLHQDRSQKSQNKLVKDW